MELELDLQLTPFDLENTLQCGQLFRWEKHGAWWYGVTQHQVQKVRQKGNLLEYEGRDMDFLKNYFRLDDNLPQIASEISRDPLIRQALKKFRGLRIVRQDPWECLISYVCATYKNIPAIRNMIFKLSQRLGEEITFEGNRYYTFPEPNELASATKETLRECGLGFRAERVLEAAEMVRRDGVDFDALKDDDYEVARKELLRLPGIGSKVADCVLLFSLEKLEAFPVDVWIRRTVQKHYADYFDATFIAKLSEMSSLSSKVYNRIGTFGRDYFGRYAGYAQEYLFHFARSNDLEAHSD